MKKIILILLVLFVTGCSNQLVCTKKITEENYETEQKITFEFDNNDKIISANVSHTMIFEDEKDANAYFEAFKNLEEDYDISVEKNKIIINSSINYNQYDYGKDKLREEIGKNGYLCK